MEEPQSEFPENADREYNESGELSIHNSYPGGIRVIVPAEPPHLNSAAGRAILRLLIAAHHTRTQQASTPEEEP